MIEDQSHSNVAVVRLSLWLLRVDAGRKPSAGNAPFKAAEFPSKGADLVIARSGRARSMHIDKPQSLSLLCEGARG